MLVPCPTCARHVRVSEATCPFCAASLPDTKTPMPGTSQRLSRAAAYAFTATVAAATGGALVACSSSSAQTQALYGAPAVIDSGSDAADDADSGGGQALYGAPAYGAQPVDSGDG